MKKLIMLAMMLGLLMICGTAIYISRTYNRYTIVRGDDILTDLVRIDKITGESCVLRGDKIQRAWDLIDEPEHIKWDKTGPKLNQWGQPEPSEGLTVDPRK